MVPVGFAPSVLVALRGIVMTSGFAKLGAGVASSKYSVATPAPLSATNIVSGDERAMPQGFTTCESVISPTPWTSDSRFSQSKPSAQADPAVINNAANTNRAAFNEVQVVFIRISPLLICGDTRVGSAHCIGRSPTRYAAKSPRSSRIKLRKFSEVARGRPDLPRSEGQQARIEIVIDRCRFQAAICPRTARNS